jgi:hypothetical protein
MTGLAVGKDKIIEVAAIITDKDLVSLDEGFERVIHCDESIMNGMDEWCTEHHRDVLPPPPPPSLSPPVRRPLSLPPRAKIIFHVHLFVVRSCFLFHLLLLVPLFSIEMLIVEWINRQSRRLNQYHRTSRTGTTRLY